MQRSPHLASLVVPATLAVHPTDLERLGLAEGGRVRLHGARGALTIDAAPDPGLAKGSAALVFNVDVDVADGSGPSSAGDLIDAASPVTDVRLESL